MCTFTKSLPGLAHFSPGSFTLKTTEQSEIPNTNVFRSFQNRVAIPICQPTTGCVFMTSHKRTLTYCVTKVQPNKRKGCRQSTRYNCVSVA